MTPLPVVYVEWLDSMGEGGWQSTEMAMTEAEAADAMLCTTVGFLVADTDDYVIVAHSHHRDPASGSDGVMAPVQIPRVAVVNVWRVLIP